MNDREIDELNKVLGIGPKYRGKPVTLDDIGAEEPAEWREPAPQRSPAMTDDDAQAIITQLHEQPTHAHSRSGIGWSNPDFEWNGDDAA